MAVDPLFPASSRRNALLITRNLPPLRGGMERLNFHIAIALAEHFQLHVIGPEGCRAFLPEEISVEEVPHRPLWRFLLGSLVASRKARRRKPSVVVAGSGLTSLHAKMAAPAGTRTVAYVHGLDMTTPNLVYRRIWLPALRRMDTAIANSRNTQAIAVRNGVAKGNVGIVNPGVEIPAPDELAARGSFRRQFGLGSVPILLSVGRLTPRKGIAEFADQALPEVVRQFPDALLVLIGDEAPNALSGAASGAQEAIKSVAERRGIATSVFFAGVCSDQLLHAAYLDADVHVFPGREVPGDVEGFGMVAIEAAARGLPTVAFAVGGIPDAVREGVSGHLVRPGDYAGLVQRIGELLRARSQAPLAESSRRMAWEFRWEAFNAKLIQLIDAPSESQVGASESSRHSHVVMDIGSRQSKARKMEALMGLTATTTPLKMLEIGTGSGGIANYFGTHPRLECRVDAIDVVDNRQIVDGYAFKLVTGTALPYADASFDVAISNHVIEHVGAPDAQRAHLAELRRVLRPGGIGYLAVPSRWQLVEPHYGLAFLSWWPEKWRSGYLRAFGKGRHYDCRPLSRREIEAMLAEAGFSYVQHYADALRLTFELENPRSALYRFVLKPVPDVIYRLLRSAFPTLIYTLKPV